jgi:hypothetical protein
MRSKLMHWVVATVVAIAVAVLVGNAMATPGNGFKGTTLVKGTFDDIDVFNQMVPQDANGSRIGKQVWLSLQKTKGPSDLYIQSNVWEVGGSTGWHTHPGHSLIILTAGSVTEYDGDDPSCTPRVLVAPVTFVDPGGSHAHLIRNEGSVPAEGYAVQLIPAGAPRRIDIPVDQVPAGCPIF